MKKTFYAGIYEGNLGSFPKNHILPYVVYLNTLYVPVIYDMGIFGYELDYKEISLFL